MANLMPMPMMAFFDANGNPLVGGKLLTYLAGTTTPTPSYTDATGTVANTNPVVLNSRGEAAVWLDPAVSHKFVLQTSTGSVVWTVDGVTTGASIADTRKIVSGTLNKSVAGGSNVTLTAAEAQNGILKFTGALTANINVIVPTSPTSRWLVVNSTTGAFTLTVKTAAGTGVVVPQGYSQQIYNDSSNVYPIGPAISLVGDVSISGAVVASGAGTFGGRLDSPTLTGMVAAFAMTTTPNGWLKANGAAVSRTVFPVLFAAIGTAFGVGDGSTTFNLPDMRGEFARGFDDGRGTADAGRLFGSAQGGAVQNITGSLGSIRTANASSTITGAFYLDGGAAGTITGATGTIYPSVGFDASRVASTAPETRPRNVALLFCIKF